MQKNNLALNEDELHISKKDVKEMINGLILRSRKNEQYAKDNDLEVMKFGKLYRTTLIGFKGIVEVTPEKTVSMIWSDILRFFNLLIIRNKMAQEMSMVENGEIKKSPLQITFNSLLKDIKEGNW